MSTDMLRRLINCRFIIIIIIIIIYVFAYSRLQCEAFVAVTCQLHACNEWQEATTKTTVAD